MRITCEKYVSEQSIYRHTILKSHRQTLLRSIEERKLKKKKKKRKHDGESKTVAKRRWEHGPHESLLLRSSSRAESQAAGGPFQSCFSHPHVRVDAPRRKHSL